MTTLTITSRHQGFGYDAAASAEAFVIIEKLAGFAAAMLVAIRSLKLGGAGLRLAQA